MVHGVVKSSSSWSLASVAMLAALISFLSLPARAEGQDLAKHFSGKTVTIIVGSAPGGNYDVFARLVARFGGKHLPANPSFSVQNMPGAGGLRGLTATMKAKPDGLTIGVMNPRWVLRELVEGDIPDFDVNTVRVLGSPSGEAGRPFLLCVRRDIATSWAEILKLGRPLKLGASAPGGPVSLAAQLVEISGGPIKMVYGYGGASDAWAAFDRKELDATQWCAETQVPRMFPEWIEKKILAPVFWHNGRPSEDWLRRIGASMPPNVFDVVNVMKDHKEAFEVGLAVGTVLGRLFVAPPGIPDAVYQAWKRAFEATVRDPGFVAAAEVAGLEVGLATAEDFGRIIRAYRELSTTGRDVLKKLIPTK
ncbi:MAG: hypothetical protein HYY45_09700 [Deltaproteobacteria bacterium]|nr:hypothetical protein [Deltaproteobacteria bacterium]